MSETRSAGADVRLWTPDVRRKASLGVLIAAGVIVLLGVLFFGLLPEQAGWFLILAIVLVALLLLFEAAVVVTGIAREERKGPAWLGATNVAPAPAEGGAPQQADDAYASVDLKCPECSNVFAAPDTGERPLHTTCPHCGAEGNVDGLPPPARAEDEYGYAGGAATTYPDHSDAEVEAFADEDLEGPEPVVISLKCPACDTKFSVEDVGERPLRATCPGCGRSGRLK